MGRRTAKTPEFSGRLVDDKPPAPEKETKAIVTPFTTTDGVVCLGSYKAPKGRAMACIMIGTVPDERDGAIRDYFDLDAIMKVYGWIRDPGAK